MLDKAKSENKAIIFVTDDAKEDWWRTFKGQTLGPRPELTAEIKAKAGVDFYMYASDRFLHFAQKYLHQAIEQSAIEELKEVRKQQNVDAVVMSLAPGLSGTSSLDIFKNAFESITFKPDSELLKKALTGLTFNPNYSDIFTKALQGITVVPNSDIWRKLMFNSVPTPSYWDCIGKAFQRSLLQSNPDLLKSLVEASGESVSNNDPSTQMPESVETPDVNKPPSTSPPPTKTAE